MERRPGEAELEAVRAAPRDVRVVQRIAYGADASIYDADLVTSFATLRIALAVPHPGDFHRAMVAREEALFATVAHPALPLRLGRVDHADGLARADGRTRTDSRMDERVLAESGGHGYAIAWGGVDLQAVLAAARASGGLGVEAALAIAVQVCDALAALHAVDIAHATIMPEHLVVSDAGRITVVGLGRAVAAGHPWPPEPRRDPEEPADPAMERLLRYVAPAQLRGQPFDAAADVWATAVVACELIGGAHPFGAPADDVHEIVSAMMADQAPSIRGPAVLRAPLALALDRDGARRPSAAALRLALLDAAARADLDLRPAVVGRALAALTLPMRTRPPAPPPGASPAPPPSPSPSAPPPAPTAEPAAPRRPCPCIHLAAGLTPDLDAAELHAYLDDLVSEGGLFSTSQHHGDVSLRRCGRCGNAVLHLLVEHEGFSGSIHHYFTPLTERDCTAVERGTINRDSYEDWAGDCPGIHVADRRPTLYQRARIGYLGIDHRLD